MELKTTLKWLGGILTTIVGGITLWWLTESPTSPLIPGSDLKITSFEVLEPIFAGERVYAELTVFNEGKTTAEGCWVSWYPDANYNDWPHKPEGTFAIPPKHNAKGKAWVEFMESGEYQTTYGIICWGRGGSGIAPDDPSWFPKKMVHVLSRR